MINVKDNKDLDLYIYLYNDDFFARAGHFNNYGFMGQLDAFQPAAAPKSR